MTTALSTLTPEQQKHLERGRRGGSQFPSIPQIRLSNKDMTQATEGEYFIEIKKKDEEPEITKIGANPEVIILYQTRTYSYYDEKNEELVAWTTDIHGYGQNPVTLFLKKDGKVTIDFDGTYNDFKTYRTKFDILDKVTGKKKGNDLKFKNVLYVLFEGKPYKMFVSNASAVGIQADGKLSFDTPQKYSMQYFTDMCYHDQKALYDFSVKLGSRLVKSPDGGTDEAAIYAKVPKPFYVMQFLDPRKLEEKELAQAIDASMQAEKAIYMIDDARKASVSEAEHKTTVEEAAEVFGEEVTPVL